MVSGIQDPEFYLNTLRSSMSGSLSDVRHCSVCFGPDGSIIYAHEV